MIIVAATDEEYELAKSRFKDAEIIKTGVGGINVIRALSDLARDTEILNFGYAGSNNIPVGTELYVGRSFLSHPSVDYSEPSFELTVPTDQSQVVDCYTSNDFVTSTKLTDPVIFDMELAFIMALGFSNVTSLKIVSDNLSLHEYEDNTKLKSPSP